MADDAVRIAPHDTVPEAVVTSRGHHDEIRVLDARSVDDSIPWGAEVDLGSQGNVLELALAELPDVAFGRHQRSRRGGHRRRGRASHMDGEHFGPGGARKVRGHWKRRLGD